MDKPAITQKEIGDRLRERRDALGLSQADVADRMDVATSTVQRAEAGTLNATVETLLAHCAALSLPLPTLIGGQDVSTEPTLNDAIRIVGSFLRIIEKQPFLAEIVNYKENDFKRLKQAMVAIKSSPSGAVLTRKKLEK